MLSKEDILSDFKSKINEAISMLSKIPVEQKAEVWNFWELITITVKLFTQVYVEDTINRANGSKSENKEEKSDRHENLLEAKSKTPNKKKGRRKKYFDEAERSENEINENTEAYNEPVSNSEHHNVDSVQNEVRTLDFTDLISYPSSVEAEQQVGTASMFVPSSVETPREDGTPSMFVPSSVEIPREDGTPSMFVPSSVEIPREDGTPSMFVPSSVETPRDDGTPSMFVPSSVETPREDGTPSMFAQSSIDTSQEEETTSMYIQIPSCNASSMMITLPEADDTLESSVGEIESTEIKSEKEKGDNHEQVMCIEIISSDQTAPTEKENKIPPLNLRKVRKKKVRDTSFENSYVITKGGNSNIMNSNRKSSRQKKKLHHEEYLYEEALSHKKNTETPIKDGHFACNDCGKILSNMTALRVHSRQHTGQRPFACQICGKAFSTNGNRIRHEIGHKGEKNFQCKECQKWFTTAKNLQIHNRVHTGEKPYICNICDKRFTQLGSLKAHIDLHKGEKKYLCPICGKAFTQKTNLDTHVLRHNKSNRQFKCDYCHHSFFTKGELERHSFKHTKERPYLCDFCPKSFTRAQYLKEHKTLHVKPIPYSCQKCKDTFPDMASMKKHKQWHKVQDSQEEQIEGEIITEEAEIQDADDIQQTCIVTTSEITGMKQIIMATDKDFPADILQQFVDSAAQIESDSLEVTHMVPVVAEMDLDGNITQVDSTDDGSQDIYQITFLDANSDSEHSNIITAVDFSAMNLLANATAQQFN